jgi:hypothetical protein
MPPKLNPIAAKHAELARLAHEYEVRQKEITEAIEAEQQKEDQREVKERRKAENKRLEEEVKQEAELVELAELERLWQRRQRPLRPKPKGSQWRWLWWRKSWQQSKCSHWC